MSEQVWLFTGTIEDELRKAGFHVGIAIEFKTYLVDIFITLEKDLVGHKYVYDGGRDIVVIQSQCNPYKVTGEIREGILIRNELMCRIFFIRTAREGERGCRIFYDTTEGEPILKLVNGQVIGIPCQLQSDLDGQSLFKTWFPELDDVIPPKTHTDISKTVEVQDKPKKFWQFWRK